jgi:hypothetical protein
LTLPPRSYGYAPGDVFATKNISFEASNLTVRNILDKIALANGNALWVVTMEQKADQQKPQAASRNGEQIADPLPWKFIPLRESETTGNK